MTIIFWGWIIGELDQISDDTVVVLVLELKPQVPLTTNSPSSMSGHGVLCRSLVPIPRIPIYDESSISVITTYSRHM